MAICHTENLADYLYKNPAGLGNFLMSFTGVTSFFRDIELFKKLEKEIIPALLNENEEHYCLRLWIADAKQEKKPIAWQ